MKLKLSGSLRIVLTTEWRKAVTVMFGQLWQTYNMTHFQHPTV